MKLRFLGCSLLLTGLLLPGCPIYGEDDDGCSVDADCPRSYFCDPVPARCEPEPTLACSRPSDCTGNATCSRRGICTSGDCGWQDIGCVAGYVCSKASGTFECVREQDLQPASGGAGGVGATSGSG